MRHFYNDKIKEVSNILYTNLLGISDYLLFKDFNIDLIEDSINNISQNFNFTEIKSNNLAGFKLLLQNKLYTKNDFANKLRILNESTNTIKIKNSGVKTWFNYRKEFISNLLLLIHLTSGSPLRETEIPTIKFRNTIESKMRNIF